MTIRQLDGPAVQGSLSVTSGSVVELKIGASPLDSRKVITFRPDQSVYIYFGDLNDAAPSVGTVSSDGLKIFKNQLVSFEASDCQPVYALAVAATTSLKLSERA